MENVSDVKLAKFEIQLNEAFKAFFTLGYAPAMPFALPIMKKDKIDNYLKNPYIKIIYDRWFSGLLVGDITGPNYQDLLEELDKLKNNSEYTCYACAMERMNIWEYESEFQVYQVKGALIFLGLLMTSIDEDFYKNEINMIADLASIFGFTEDMLKDWSAAVKYFLDGNKFSNNIPINFSSSLANLFFKHTTGNIQSSEIKWKVFQVKEENVDL